MQARAFRPANKGGYHERVRKMSYPQRLEVPRREPRIIDPNQPVEAQYKVLQNLIMNPPAAAWPYTICPELAERIVAERNGCNRDRRLGRIKVYQTDIAAGNWVLTGQTITFGKSGKLLDGQNRLMACIRAGVSFASLIAFGIDDLAFSVIDIGTKRTNADALKIEGITRHKIAAPALRWLMIYENGTPEDRGAGYENKAVLERHTLMTATEKAWLDRATLTALHATGRTPRPALAAHLFMFMRKDLKTAERMIKDLETPQGPMKKYLAAIADLYARAGGRITELAANIMIVTTWNAYRGNTPATKAGLIASVGGGVVPEIG
jgi:hypothetical protein